MFHAANDVASNVTCIAAKKNPNIGTRLIFLHVIRSLNGKRVSVYFYYIVYVPIIIVVYTAHTRIMRYVSLKSDKYRNRSTSSLIYQLGVFSDVSIININEARSSSLPKNNFFPMFEVGWSAVSKRQRPKTTAISSIENTSRQQTIIHAMQ